MVVTRKGTSTPIPPNSRTNSSTSSPKLKPKKTVNGTPQTGSSPLQPIPPLPAGAASHARLSEKPDPVGPEFDDPIKILPSPKKSPAKPKSKSKSKKAIVKTPTPPTLFDLVRRYVRLITLFSLLFYSFVVCPHDGRQESPVCNTLHDFSGGLNHYILRPYVLPQVDKLLAHPRVQPVVRYAQPVIQPIVQGAATIAKPIRTRLNDAYVIYASPRIRELQNKAAPHINMVESKYKQTLEPYVLQAQAYGRVIGRITEPYIRLVVMSLRHSWVQLKPYAHVLGRYSLEVPGLIKVHIWNPTFAAIKVHVWRPALELYSAYVEPHLTKMFETVEELGGDAKATPTPSRFEKTFGARAAETRRERKAEPVVVEDDEDDETMATDIPSPTLAKTPSDSAPDQATTGSAHVNPEDIHKLFDQVENLDDVGEDELAAFLQELNESAAGEAPESTAGQPRKTAQKQENPEEIAERTRKLAEETAEKRKEIQTRHTQWEEKLNKLIDEQVTTRLPELLKEVRQDFVDELKTLKFGEPIQTEVDKTMSNVEAFIKKIMVEKTGGAEKVALLDDLVQKIHKKFEASTDVISKNIVAWWELARKEEGNLIEELAKEALNLASTAQADIGLDYSWLDDVSVGDWRRYHALVRTAETHKQQMIEIANGSDPRSPPNALSVAMRELQLELQGILFRFQSTIGETHKKALRRFTGNAFEDEKPSHSRDEEDPTMSILPIPEEPIEDGEGIEVTDPEDDTLEPEMQHAFVGRSKDEVEDAIKRADTTRDEL